MKLMCIPEKKLKQEMSTIQDWKLVNNTINKKFYFDDFNKAFGFMTRSALHIEKLNHHPSWKNTFNIVEISLTTHDVGGITKKDIELAKILNEIQNDS